MPVQWISEGDLYANSYIYGSVLVDAGVTPMAVKPFRDTIDTIVLTHCHYDHTAYVKEIAHMCKAKVAIHRADATGLLDEMRCLSMHFGARPPGIVPDTMLADGDTIGTLRVLHTPGHTPGSICLWDEEAQVLISGDTVFTDGAFGRYDFLGGSRQELARSLDRISALAVEGLYPGHGQPVDNGGRHHIAAAHQLLRSGYG
ncbi:MAG: MBL fold metallo-hydrolase [Methanoregula sp.]|nr:MBL fold metallo-hydrolase [Methanoregula sp.]